MKNEFTPGKTLGQHVLESGGTISYWPQRPPGYVSEEERRLQERRRMLGDLADQVVSDFFFEGRYIACGEGTALIHVDVSATDMSNALDTIEVLLVRTDD